MNIKFKEMDPYRWIIPKEGKMRVDGLIYCDRDMLDAIQSEQSPSQVANVAQLPGIVGRSMAMADIHWGYGFPIGGVAAFEEREGVISPGGVGYDINCGVRLLKTNLEPGEVGERIRDLVRDLFNNIPTGVGSRRKDLKLSRGDLNRVLKSGASWAVSNGFGTDRDLEHIEEKGRLEAADPNLVSDKAKERGKNQLGTLGSGNHFVEIGIVDEVYDEEAAAALGLRRGGVTVIVHTGSRGLGHQVCDDSIKVMMNASRKYGIELPDRQLCCAPIRSEEGERYFGAMSSAANFAFANRQIITHWVRETFYSTLGRGPGEIKIDLVYDVCHNIAKMEKHEVDGEKLRVCVHRKGATRALPPGHPKLPSDYARLGQPVLIPGDMGRYSFVLLGTDTAAAETFSSTCHGAGRVLSRTKAQKVAKGRAIARELEDKGIIVRSAGRATLAEEISDAYKDVANVVDVVHNAGISRKVVKLKPIGVIKG